MEKSDVWLYLEFLVDTIESHTLNRTELEKRIVDKDEKSFMYFYVIWEFQPRNYFHQSMYGHYVLNKFVTQKGYEEPRVHLIPTIKLIELMCPKLKKSHKNNFVFWAAQYALNNQ